MSRDSNIFEYEELLLGQRKCFRDSFRRSDTLASKQKAAGIIWNYAITELLHWTPQDAQKLLTPEIVQLLCLDRVIAYFGYNNKRVVRADYTEFLHYAFKDEIRYSLVDQVRIEYDQAMKRGKWAKDSTPYKFPKKFFSDEDGDRRSKIMMMYALNLYMSDKSMKELYTFFSNEQQALLWLTDKKLRKAFTECYYKTPLEFFHYSLPSNKRDDLYFFNFLLKQNFEKHLAKTGKTCLGTLS